MLFISQEIWLCALREKTTFSLMELLLKRAWGRQEKSKMSYSNIDIAWRLIDLFFSLLPTNFLLQVFIIASVTRRSQSSFCCRKVQDKNCAVIQLRRMLRKNSYWSPFYWSLKRQHREQRWNIVVDYSAINNLEAEKICEL